jgi:hypothetical protein
MNYITVCKIMVGASAVLALAGLNYQSDRPSAGGEYIAAKRAPEPIPDHLLAKYERQFCVNVGFKTSCPDWVKKVYPGIGE